MLFLTADLWNVPRHDQILHIYWDNCRVAVEMIYLKELRQSDMAGKEFAIVTSS